jgi:hypothetical protein
LLFANCGIRKFIRAWQNLLLRHRHWLCAGWLSGPALLQTLCFAISLRTNKFKNKMTRISEKY